MTVTEQTAQPTPKLDFAAVVEGVFGVLRRNFWTFVALAAVLQAAPLIVIYGGVASLESGGGTGFGLLSLGGVILSVASAILTPALVHGTVADLNGRKAAFGECLKSGLRHAIPVFAVLFVATIGIAFGLLFFVVPGVMLGLAWCVAAPAKVVERVGVFGALGRSRTLTRGSRWRLFWLIVLYSIVWGAIQQALLGAVGALPTAASATLGPGAFLSPGYGMVMLVLSVAGTLISYTGLAVIYYELRRIKEGIGPEALAAIFD